MQGFLQISVAQSYEANGSEVDKTTGLQTCRFPLFFLQTERSLISCALYACARNPIKIGPLSCAYMFLCGSFISHIFMFSLYHAQVDPHLSVTYLCFSLCHFQTLRLTILLWEFLAEWFLILCWIILEFLELFTGEGCTHRTH